MFPRRRCVVGQPPPPRVEQICLPLDDIGPAWRRRVLEVGHETLRARVERVDHHLAVCRAGNLYAAIEEVGGNVADPPIPGADRSGFRQEVGERAGIEGPLPFRPRLQRSEEHTSELQSLMRISYAVFCLTKKKTHINTLHNIYTIRET